MDAAQLVERARASLAEHGGGVDEAAFATLAARLGYVDGDYADAGTSSGCAPRSARRRRPTHYLAIPPSMFPTVVEQPQRAGLTEARGSWSRSFSGATARPRGR